MGVLGGAGMGVARKTGGSVTPPPTQEGAADAVMPEGAAAYTGGAREWGA